MIDRFEVKIPALTGEKKRNAYVYVPDCAKTGERLPVTYMFDGHNLFSDEEATFGKSWGLSDWLEKSGKKVIIAAVECNHEGNSRLSEYTPVPFTFKDGSYIPAKGKEYMDWLVGEFKPFIDDNYYTLDDRKNTAIGGSSMGGLMTLYALAVYGKTFSRGAALSPSLWVEKGKNLTFLKEAEFPNDVKLYMDYGSKEFKNHSPQRRAFAAVCSLLIRKGVNLTARVVEGGTHSEASWERQIPYFFSALFPEADK